MGVDYYLTVLPWGLLIAVLSFILIVTTCVIVGTRGQRWHPLARNSMIGFAVVLLVGMMFGIGLQSAIDQYVDQTQTNKGRPVVQAEQQR